VRFQKLGGEDGTSAVLGLFIIIISIIIIVIYIIRPICIFSGLLWPVLCIRKFVKEIRIFYLEVVKRHITHTSR
jgi:hypothetical protein